MHTTLKFKLFFTLLFIVCQIKPMDKPFSSSLVIPEGIKSEYETEIKKLNKLKIDSSQETFSTFLKKELKPRNIQGYRKFIDEIASLLRLQDELMMSLNIRNYAKNEFDQFKKNIVEKIEDPINKKYKAPLIEWLFLNYPVLLNATDAYLKQTIDYVQQFMVPIFFNNTLYQKLPIIAKNNSQFARKIIDAILAHQAASDRMQQKYGLENLKTIPDFYTEFNEYTIHLATLYKLLRSKYAELYKKLIHELNSIEKELKITSPQIVSRPDAFGPLREPSIIVKPMPIVEIETLIKKLREEEKVPKERKKIKDQSSVDKSYILEGDEDTSHIIIHNEDKGYETLFKNQQKPASNIKIVLPLNYTKNVIAWFNDSQKALLDQGYLNPGHKNFTSIHLRERMIERHAFSHLVDNYINSLGIITQTQNRRNLNQVDILISIPGQITYSDGNNEIGYFSYIVDSKTKECYHRIFEPSDSKKMTTQLLEHGALTPENPSFYDIAFPALP